MHIKLNRILQKAVLHLINEELHQIFVCHRVCGKSFLLVWSLDKSSDL